MIKYTAFCFLLLAPALLCAQTSPTTPDYSIPNPGSKPYVPSGLFSTPAPQPGSLLVPAFPASPAPAASEPAAKDSLKPSDIATPADDAYTKGLARFNEGLYTQAISILQVAGRDSSSPLPTRKLYIAALVADGQLSMAAFQAVDVARIYPLAFFGEPTLASTYQKNPELSIHLNAVREYAHGNNGQIDTCILFALYYNLANRTPDAVDLLATVKVPDADKEWFTKLQSTLKAKN